MIKVLAKLKLLSGNNKRKTPFISGYRPLFEFIEGRLTSGSITLIDRKLLYPGEETKVEIIFLNKELLGNDFDIGVMFNFYEAKEILGTGKIIKIINHSSQV